MDDNRFDDHGTCVASVACSSVGIMTRGTLVAVKVSLSNGYATAGDVFIAFGWAIDDVVNKERQGKSVINLSIGKSIVYKMTFVHTNLLYSWRARPREEMGGRRI
jgi:subtilase family protein